MKRIPRKIGVLYSGGLDSAALLKHFLKKNAEIYPIYIRCGLKWEHRELQTARKFLKKAKDSRLKPLKILKISLEDAYNRNWSQTGKIPPRFSNDREVFLPGRNLLLITKAFLYLTSKNITSLSIGVLKGNPFPDGKRPFFNNLERLLSQSFKQKLSIITPFHTLTKKEVIKRFDEMPLRSTFSCIAPKKGKPCGNCNKCGERLKVFRNSRQ